MKRIALYLIALCLLSSCGGKVDESLKYDGEKTISIALLDEMNLNVTSESENPITYYSDNEMVVTVDPTGVIKGKNIGEANITVSNTTNEIIIKVIVTLYEEPTMDFGASTDEIIDIYGSPKHIVYNSDTTAFIYGSGNDWYSYAVWEMDFFFINNQYIESDLYIRNSVEPRLDEFLNNNYYYHGNDTINEDVYYIYLNEEQPEDATVMIGKINDVGQYGDICIFYIPFDYEERTDYKGIIRRKLKRI